MPSRQRRFNKTKIPVAGMSCGSCVQRINTALQAQEGIDTVKVDLASRAVTVSYIPETILPDAIIEAIRRSGYRPGTPEYEK